MTTPAGEVRIRPYRLDDANAVWAAALESVAEMNPWMPWCHHNYTLNQSASWLEIQVPAFKHGTTFEFAITSATGVLLGGCGLNRIDTVNKRANLAYWVRSTTTRRGVATAAIQMLRDWAFEKTDLIRLEIVIAVGNKASRRAAEKSGAVCEGILRSRFVLHGITHDAVVFSFVRPHDNDKTLEHFLNA